VCGLKRIPSPDDRQRSQTASKRSGATTASVMEALTERQTKRPPIDSEAA